jgi:type IV pilus assembly protein PilW
MSTQGYYGLRSQRGLSLIELMIAMALGLILTLGVVQIFLGSSKTYRLSDELGKIQENSRFSQSYLQREIRMAGHFGCLVSPLRLTNHLDEDGDNYEDLSYGILGNDFVPLPVIGWEGQDTGR